MPVVDIIHPQNNKFVIGVKTKATGDSQINDSLEWAVFPRSSRSVTNARKGGLQKVKAEV